MERHHVFLGAAVLASAVMLTEMKPIHRSHFPFAPQSEGWESPARFESNGRRGCGGGCHRGQFQGGPGMHGMPGFLVGFRGGPPMMGQFMGMPPEARAAFFEHRREMMQHQMELRAKFMATLTPEQKEMFSQLRGPGMMGFGPFGHHGHHGFGRHQGGRPGWAPVDPGQDQPEQPDNSPDAAVPVSAVTAPVPAAQ